MSVIYCHACDLYVDTDYDVDHEFECEAKEETPEPQNPPSGVRMALWDNREVW